MKRQTKKTKIKKEINDKKKGNKSEKNNYLCKNK
jgi:hypothetical protein